MQDTALVMMECQGRWQGKENRETQKTLLEHARGAGIPIFHVFAGFEEGAEALGYADHGLRRVWRESGTWNERFREVDEGFEVLGGEFLVRGRVGCSAFAGSNLDHWMRYNGIGRFILGGVASHETILATLMAAHDLGYTVIVPHEVFSGGVEDSRAVLWRQMASSFGWSKPLAATLEHLVRRREVVETVSLFFAGLEGANLDQIRGVMDPKIRVEGEIDGVWHRWGLETYLERVRGFSGMLRGRGEILRLKLVRHRAEVDTRLPVEGGVFEDRLSLSRGDGGWKIRHKGFLWLPGAQ